ncbi:nickel-dependent lactate racemase [Desulfosporosinus sp. BICA1-9]|uniref:nickel-dependent lactate racemase n=1 Tax=Desulfosporosinus sp. BICA1-9 TaxID=1531958 RepID=UPI00054B795E|nr:nickel-dependent lactate racemase [Desulfosporosinus sp. BICA1-9]KJS48858.1 MAG: hypothetical protein VR66_11735 [Peptococcaceae bacterium BRH_c23]KJS83048.1 MAG: hypothetical protein JL57_23230 [Desulfosporosinus sp. BICA1-9]HBV88427.1 nickel-dependent lactate racemase [Desulfosporosinus sp.]
MNNLKYGQSTTSIPEELLRKSRWLIPPDTLAPLENEHEGINMALRNPVGCKALSELVQPTDKIAIIVSDNTRPVPTYKLLPSILEELHCAGIEEQNITIVFALGIHRRMTTEEEIQVIGREVVGKYKTVQPMEYVFKGRTSRNTPIEVCREVDEADFLILTGNIEFHYFAGYSGGYKALMPGVSTRDAIQNNHKMMLDPRAAIGCADGNPLREDIEEFGRQFPRTFLVNVVLNSDKEIIHVVAGDPILAHRSGCKVLDQCYKVAVPEFADLVIVSAGGYPKDMNLYQAQKALENAARVTKEGGKIVLVAELREGFGEDIFEDWLMNSSTIDEIISKINEEFILGGHKAAAIAKLLKKHEVLLFSALHDDIGRKAFFTPLKDLYELTQGTFECIYIIPYGNQTLPEVVCVNKG